MGVDGLEVGGRLPARERRARHVEEERHFRMELAPAKDKGDAPGLIVGAHVLEEGLDGRVFGGRRDYLDVLGRHCEDCLAMVAIG